MSVNCPAKIALGTGIPVHDAKKELKLTRAQNYTQYTGVIPPDSS